MLQALLSLFPPLMNAFGALARGVSVPATAGMFAQQVGRTEFAKQAQSFYASQKSSVLSAASGSPMATALLTKVLPAAATGVSKLTSTMVSLTANGIGLTRRIEQWTTSISEGNRHLARWNGSLAASYAQLDIARMNSTRRTADATAGSAIVLNQAITDLMHEFEPIQESLFTAVNILGIGAAKLAQLLAILLKYSPLLQLMLAVLNSIEQNTKKDNNAQDPIRDLLQGLARMPGNNAQMPIAPVQPRAPLPPLRP